MVHEFKYQLELKSNWEFYNGSEFVRFFPSKYFKDGMVLRKKMNKGYKYFYLRSHGLNPLKEYDAYRKIILYTLENSTTLIDIYNVSKRKSLITLNIGNNEKIEYVVRKSDKLLKKVKKENLEANNRIYRKSFKLLLEVVKRDRRISMIKQDNLLVHSKNGNNYTININTGIVEDSNGRFLCVQVPYSHAKNLGTIDIVIAKALTITHFPGKIYTL
ncbi:MAG: hypothetical protein GF329_00395 [Candidatus Lokiarchaeota archaeon]|nr:hypothetical protein [Candidatus Lokiarchaeota archaeon]